MESARLAAQTRCRDVAVLDLAVLWPVADYFIIATGSSARQMRTVADEITQLGGRFGMKAYSRSGYEGETWIAVDFIDVVVHIFSPAARVYYDLENLWGDAPKIPWDQEKPNLEEKANLSIEG